MIFVTSSEQYSTILSIIKHRINVYKIPTIRAIIICMVFKLFSRVRSQGHHMFGVTLTFIATRSGLLRWRDHGANNYRGSDP